MKRLSLLPSLPSVFPFALIILRFCFIHGLIGFHNQHLSGYSVIICRKGVSGRHAQLFYLFSMPLVRLQF